MFKLRDIDISWFGHASFKIGRDKTIYIDPYELNSKEKNADLILITHEHYDHCDKKKIKQLLYEGTHIVASEGCEGKLLDLNGNLSNKIVIVRGGEDLVMNGLRIHVTPAYNTSKKYHKKGFGVGYVLEIEKKKFYFAGDTDFIPEMEKLFDQKIDVAFMPVGGKYTMDAKEAAEAVKVIKPKIAIPMHYGKIVGSKKDAEDFKKLVGNFCEVRVMEKS